jgi:hypothetical protein
VTQPYQPQPGYPQQPPPPQAPPKKKRRLLWIGILLGILFLASCGAIIGAISGEDEDAATTAQPSTTQAGSQAPKPKPKGSEPPAEKTYKMGEKATDDAYQFTVTKIRCGVKKVGDAYSNEKAQGQFCLVSMRVKNVGNDAIDFSDENQALVDAKGKNYSPDDEAWIYLDTDPYAEINPGNTLKTTVPFDIPRKAKPDHLLLKAGTFGFSEGVKVKLS